MHIYVSGSTSIFVTVSVVVIYICTIVQLFARNWSIDSLFGLFLACINVWIASLINTGESVPHITHTQRGRQ